MTNKPKVIGTKGESAVVKYARANGFPLAERIVLHGRDDQGDVRLDVGCILEVKSGKAAQSASYNQKLAWMVEAETERVNAGADIAALVVQARGFGTGRVAMWEFWTLTTVYPIPAVACFRLEDGLKLLRCFGWGDALLDTTYPTTKDNS